MEEKENKKIKEKKKAKKPTFSKILCAIAVSIFTAVAIYTIVEYYLLMQKAVELGSMVTPDVTLPITAITSILASVLTYCLYQGALKTNLNKHKLTIDDNGVVKPILQELFKDKDNEEY